MTGTDKCRNSWSRSGTPSQENPVPQPVFHPGSHALQMQGLHPSPTIGEDPFRVYAPAGHLGVINLNDDMPQMQNTPVPGINIQGPVVQEGRHFQWQLPQPPVPAVRRHAARHAREVHPENPNKLWCTKSGHWVESAVFGSLSTCEACRAAGRARNAQLRDQRLAQEAQALATMQLAEQVGNISQVSQVVTNNNSGPPSTILPLIDPLLESAVSANNKILLENCRNKLMDITMDSCDLCHEKWFNLGVENGVCVNCKKGSKFQASNNMYPGDRASHLPELTQMEEMLISPVHALVQLWQIRGGQTKYTGHTCNFPRETAVFHNKVPLLPEECDIIIMRRTGVEAGTNETIYQDFRVRRHVIQQWLEYLTQHHPTFQSRQVTVDYTRLNQLPVNGSVHNRLRTMENEQMEDAFLNTGPPEASHDGDAPQQEPLFSAGFVPNLQDRQTEEDHLRQAALQSDDPIILTMPPMRGTPISEYAGHQIAIDAFPSLFPTGMADIAAQRDESVEMKDWALHLMRFKDGRFARHPRFRYWVLNTMMRKTAQKASNWYLHTHKEDRDLTVEEIREMIEAGDAASLAQRVSHAGIKLAGSKPFWQSAQKDLIAQIRAPDIGTPHVFFTCSSADVQWPDMHRHMPNNDPDAAENATSYRIRMNDLNNNPAIAAYYFQRRWQIFFDEVIKPKFKIKDSWWRYEWQHRGSSHIHGFLWMEDAPSVDALDINNPDSVAAFIHFWDQHVSTWHPNKDCPPAAIHPSAQMFNTLQDTKKELAEMLNRFQRHTKCAPGYCERKKKDSGEIFCRFGYPKRCRDHSELSKDAGREFVELNTRRNDEILNSYNALFILGWRANIDFRPVINKEAVIAYVAKYASKGETSSSSYQDTLQKAIGHLQDSDAAGIVYQKMLSSFAAERDISSQEACHILFGLSLVKSTRMYRSLFIAPDESSETVNFAASEKEQRGILERYKTRPITLQPELEHVSLFEFATSWNWKGNKYTKRGSRGAKPFVVNVWPRYQPDRNEPESYEIMRSIAMPECFYTTLLSMIQKTHC
jgi:ATP-dependent DNA helicase PIF1